MTKQIKDYPITDIGQLTGKVLLFGGVYSNLQALEKMQEIAEQEGIPAQNIICMGDIAGYCANPEAAQQLVRRWGVHCIAGNVEIQIRDGLEDCGCDFTTDSRCDLFAKKWYPYAQQKTSQETVAWLQEMPEFIRFDYYGRSCVVVHGSYFHTSEFVFKSTPWAAKDRNFSATQSEVIFAGHCGLPFHDSKDNKYWLNPGVIGMPANDGTTRVWYMLLEPGEENLQFQHRSFEYDHEEAFARMLETELPIDYAKTLTSGLWDNNDILPEEETAAQGKALDFESVFVPRN
ncbi:MAG TPA: metallophosphoesterase family protein [Saprospiraceae bacterium]|nr:metallophosphoesterase family protein [Saprospiraceae bacterium]